MKSLFSAWFKANKGSRFWRTSLAIQERYEKQMVRAREKVREMN